MAVRIDFIVESAIKLNSLIGRVIEELIEAVII